MKGKKFQQVTSPYGPTNAYECDLEGIGRYMPRALRV
jgi:hypothetical protein